MGLNNYSFGSSLCFNYHSDSQRPSNGLRSGQWPEFTSRAQCVWPKKKQCVWACVRRAWACVRVHVFVAMPTHLSMCIQVYSDVEVRVCARARQCKNTLACVVNVVSDVRWRPPQTPLLWAGSSDEAGVLRGYGCVSCGLGGEGGHMLKWSEELISGLPAYVIAGILDNGRKRAFRESENKTERQRQREREQEQEREIMTTEIKTLLFILWGGSRSPFIPILRAI